MTTTKRVSPGCYIYKGYTIERVKEFGITQWNIFAPGSFRCNDCAGTLRDAKFLVDLSITLGK